jgi:hypothetical protein
MDWKSIPLDYDMATITVQFHNFVGMIVFYVLNHHRHSRQNIKNGTSDTTIGLSFFSVKRLKRWSDFNIE